MTAELKYTKTHEWIREENEEIVVGLTDYAQNELGDIVFVELPDVGSSRKSGESMGVLESVKAVSDFYSPVDGDIVAVNEELESAPEKVNESSMDEGWLVRMKPDDISSLSALMDEEQYKAFVAGQ